ncbi:MAG TPA: ATP-binding protein [Planctomycetota bacterium]
MIRLPEPPKTRVEPETLPDLARQGILIDLLSVLVQAREPDELWTAAVQRMKWLLEFDRVNLALFDSHGNTYSLKTIFESRPGVPLFSAVRVSRQEGCVAAVGADHDVILRIPSDGIPAGSVVDPDLEGGSLSRILVVLLRADGKSIGALCFGSSQPDAYGNRELEIAVTLAAHASVVFARTQDLRGVLRELEAFSYTVAHDLRAPIRSIHQRAEVLLADESASLSVAGQDSLRRVISSADQMDRLINGLIAFSQLGRSEIPLTRVSLGACVRRVLAELAEDLGRVNAEITLEGDLGDVLGNELFLLQVFRNLLENALKFVRPGARPWIRIQSELRDRRVRVWVEDRGIGLSPAEIARLFRVFERIHSGERYPGTGIGLAIVLRAVEKMGGAVGVESEPGRGSRFWFEIAAA